VSFTGLQSQVFLVTGTLAPLPFACDIAWWILVKRTFVLGKRDASPSGLRMRSSSRAAPTPCAPQATSPGASRLRPRRTA
jgi:hypothetical protein